MLKPQTEKTTQCLIEVVLSMTFVLDCDQDRFGTLLLNRQQRAQSDLSHTTATVWATVVVFFLTWALSDFCCTQMFAAVCGMAIQ
eukprot:5580207-Amphidinium_carterae.1